jgi:hypothetical protein
MVKYHRDAAPDSSGKPESPSDPMADYGLLTAKLLRVSPCTAGATSHSIAGRAHAACDVRLMQRPQSEPSDARRDE